MKLLGHRSLHLSAPEALLMPASEGLVFHFPYRGGTDSVLLCDKDIALTVRTKGMKDVNTTSEALCTQKPRAVSRPHCVHGG